MPDENKETSTPENEEVSNSSMNKKEIHRKLLGIMTTVSFIEKDKRNDFHKYNYASEEAIKKALHQALVKFGVIFKLSATDLKREGTITDISFTYRFTDVESGQFEEGTFIGTGEDKLDKGTYKAITGAIKYILTSTFLIPTGDDPEDEKPPKPISKPNFTPKATEPLKMSPISANPETPSMDHQDTYKSWSDKVKKVTTIEELNGYVENLKYATKTMNAGEIALLRSEFANKRKELETGEIVI